MKKQCRNCHGSGQMMGGGMMKMRCNFEGCENGFIYIDELPAEAAKKQFKLDKRSSEYKAAIKEIMALGLSKEEAEKQFLSTEKDLNKDGK